MSITSGSLVGGGLVSLGIIRHPGGPAPGGPVNGSVVTLTGTGFGAGPTFLTPFDYVDNQVAYSGALEGSVMPTIQGGTPSAPYHTVSPEKDITLSYLDTYGTDEGRPRDLVMKSAGDSYVDRPVGIDNDQQGHTKIFIRFKVWADFNQFVDSELDNKLIRAWDEVDGTAGRVSVEINNTYYGDNLQGGIRASDTIRGRGPQSGWVEHEAWLDFDSHVIRTKHFNIKVASISDPLVAISNPAATGFFIKVLGYDNGGVSTASNLFRYTDFYVTDSETYVELCSASDRDRALIREVQGRVVSWADGSVSYVLDGRRIDPANHWEFLVKDGVTQSIRKVGDPIEVKQNIARPTFGVHNAAALYFLGTWTCSSALLNFTCAFHLVNAACTSVEFMYNGFNTRIRYVLASSTWEIRFGSGTEFSVASTLGNLDDGQNRWLRVQAVATGFTIELADYVEDAPVSGATWTLDASGTGTCNAATCTQVARANGGTAGVLKGYVWEYSAEDVAAPANSKHWKLDEQVGSGNNTHIMNYAQDTNGVDDKMYFSTIDTGWDWLPGEGY